MGWFQKVFTFLNPVDKLGRRKYSFFFPLAFNVFAAILIELYVNFLINDPEAVGLYAIVIFILSIIYFSFRDGVRGGFISVGVTIIYYSYIIYSRNYTEDRLLASIQTVAILSVMYTLLAGIIGWLKQTIDYLIEKEADEKQRLKTVFHQLPVGVIVVDKNMEVIQVNRIVRNTFDIKTFPKSMFKVNNLKSNPPLLQLCTLLNSTLQSGRSSMNKEVVVKRPLGKKITLSVSTSPVKNITGKIMAVSAIIEDITQQKELNKRKDDFVNMASHELKTPITSLKLYIELLTGMIKKHDDKRELKIITNIHNQSDKLLTLVNDLLDVSRLNTGKLLFKHENFRIDNLIQETIDELQETSSQKIVFSARKPITVYADRFRIYQVLTNLITNAIKYSAGKGNIIVKASRADSKAIVSVQDYGIGIQKSQQKKIFERLYQAGNDNHKVFPGFGMGLYISKAIVSRHKGRIWVISEENKGSTFYFTLPTSHN